MADIMEEDPSSGLQSSEEEEELPVESLVKGRAKRSTAGLHMSALLEAAADDDLALLFEEVEDDNEFADVLDPDAEDELLESSDEDEDQGPNAQNDYEGEQKLQKEERRKRKTQNDLRFQTLRKRVKIDPTAPSTMSAAPRPKKKSERISWIPTVEDGPTRQSSRRQTMVNKELTHARLKDSQEKRVRIIATMKEAEKRKAHLKPKQMTQEDHLAEAARVERLNSKSLNRWELSEKRKADERRARIEALQNRRLDGPVISYWSGVATWTNGRLTRVGKIEIKPKSDKEESKKKKKEKEEKEKSTAGLQSGPATIAGHAHAIPSGSFAVEIRSPPILAQPNSNTTLNQKPHEDKPSSNTAAPTTAQNRASVSQPDAGVPETIPGTTHPAEQGKDNAVEKTISEVAASTSVPPSEEDKPKAETDDRKSSEPSKSSERKLFAVEIPAPRQLSNSSNGAPKTLPDQPPTKDNDPMDVDPQPDAGGPTVQEPQATQPVSESRPVESAAPVVPGITLAPQAPSAATTPNQAAVPADALLPGLHQSSTSQPESQTPNEVMMGPELPKIPQPPPVIEHTGRSLTILENFDYATANNRKYSMYFNSKKPARLTSTLYHITFPISHRSVLLTSHQKSRHRFASLLHCLRVTATQRPPSLTPTPTHMVKSAVCYRRGTSGARCLGASSARPRLPAACPNDSQASRAQAQSDT
jgi:vacuolar protein sorting-associated protein 72